MMMILCDTTQLTGRFYKCSLNTWQNSTWLMTKFVRLYFMLDKIFINVLLNEASIYALFRHCSSATERIGDYALHASAVVAIFFQQHSSTSHASLKYFKYIQPSLQTSLDLADKRNEWYMWRKLETKQHHPSWRVALSQRKKKAIKGLDELHHAA